MIFDQPARPTLEYPANFCAPAGTGIADSARGYRSHPPPPQRHAIGHAASAVVWGKFLDFLGAGLRGLRSTGILRGCPSFRVLCETAGTFSKPRRGGCPHPPGWGLFSRSRTESAFTHLSFRIRFSGEESAFCRGAHPFAFFAKRRGLFPSHVGAGALTRPGGDFFRAAEQNLLSHTCHSEERHDEESAVINLSFRIRFSGICFLQNSGNFFQAT